MNKKQTALSKTGNKDKTKKLAITGMLGAVSIMLSLTPLGYLPLGFFSVTTMHIPVIIAAILEGPIVGGAVGLIFGVTSLAKHFMAPQPISFIFWNPLISVLPRVLIGVLSYYFYRLLYNLTGKDKLTYFATGIFGTFVNTFFVLGGAYVLYAKGLVEKFQLTTGAGVFLLGIAVKNGIPEMLISAIITVSVVIAIKKIKK
ncbi:MAG: ECF transporter S component [Peptostreptococcaceae bacterium]|nr:ECF transporter S component [Peptostreptococcaceae bacterium]